MMFRLGDVHRPRYVVNLEERVFVGSWEDGMPGLALAGFQIGVGVGGFEAEAAFEDGRGGFRDGDQGRFDMVVPSCWYGLR